MSAQEYLELAKLYSPSLYSRITEHVHQAAGTSDTANLAVKFLSTEAVAERYAELTAALIGCNDLQACALVKNHADLLFMENQNSRSHKLGSSKFDVIAHEAFSLAFERSMIKASEQAQQEGRTFTSKLSLIDGLITKSAPAVIVADGED